ncbi:CsiV family protein [Marinimicrobium alkaliphilum]|uniref:CsiV family protein n=1 Tax=Marinimicrobium alkaliphilum TaxID=2202654 RepID=UPI000DB956BD|nr:CsiV family protein [Marinimicrobium alkaliphilum]
MQALLRKPRLPLIGLLAGLTLLAVTAPSVQAEEERWFQVEVIAFSRPAATGSEEHWPKDIRLQYPARWQQLLDPQQTIRETPVRDGPMADPLVPTMMREPDLRRDPFYTLPSGERELGRFANAFQRSPDYQLLFHEAWRQPVEDESRARAILISAGEQFGEHHELEGSIRLHVSRFLHLQTRLWLTQFEVNYGQDPAGWPALPLSPALAPSDSIDAAQAPLESDPWEVDFSSAYLGDFSHSLGDAYLPRRIATLNQSRRMRSGELHYIDHPFMGLVVKITPYSLPD